MLKALVCMNVLAVNAEKRKTLSLSVMFGEMLKYCNELGLTVYRIPINKINSFMPK